MSQNKRVLLVGDSLALGLTAPLKRLAEERGVELYGDGRTSTTARQWVTGGWLSADISAHQPNITLISLGTNDAAGDLSSWPADLATLIDQATAHGGVVAWIEPPSFAPSLKNFPAGNVDRMRTQLHEVLGARGIQAFPTLEHDYARAADSIHMTPKGYDAWAHDVAAFAHLDVAAPEAAPKASWWGAMSGKQKLGVGLSVVGLGVATAYLLDRGGRGA